LRYAAAHLREACRARANGGPLAYAALVDAQMLATAVDPSWLRPRDGKPSTFAALGREDIAQKVFGTFDFIHDLVLPGMLHGRVFRPATLQGQVDEARWPALQSELAALPGVLQVVRDGMLLGVIAGDEHALARASVKVTKAQPWSGTADVPAPHLLATWLKTQPLETSVVRAPQQAPANAARVFRAEYARAYLHHASIGLCCALAHWTGAELKVWSHSQGIFNLRRDLALAFALPADAVTVQHAVGAGCYGHNGADDVAFDAAWLARQAQGRPLRLQWTREQEMANSPLGPAMLVGVEASVDDAGRLVGWKQEVWSQGHGTRPGRGKTPALLGAWQTAEAAPVTLAVNPPEANGGGAERNAVPPYALPSLEVLNHRVLSMPLRVSALRSLGAHVNVLAAESMIDEVARALQRDPLAYRLAHLEDPRAQAVLREVGALCAWDQPRTRRDGHGRGIAFARYKNTGAWCAVVADIQVTDRVRLRELYIAADLGLVVHPDGARNQIEGGAVQAASWTLCEAADIGREGVRSVDWDSYPILRFSEVPRVQVSLLDRPDSPSLGAGECSAGPTAAAIANAIHDALGIRVRTMPFTTEALMREAHRSA
jgi:nicotinate dehydrogenase subunit B